MLPLVAAMMLMAAKRYAATLACMPDDAARCHSATRMFMQSSVR